MVTMAANRRSRARTVKAMDGREMDYGATDHGGDVHLTLESDDGAPSNANRGHGVSTSMPRLGVTGPRGMGRARRRLDLGGEVDVRGGCDDPIHPRAKKRESAPTTSLSRIAHSFSNQNSPPV